MKWLAACLGFLGLCSALSAQPKAPPAWRSEVTVIVTDGSPPAGSFYLAADGTQTPVQIFGFSRAPAFVYAGPANLSLWQPGEQGGKPRLVASVPLKEPVGPKLVVLKPNPKASEPDQPTHFGVAIDDAATTFAWGSVRVVNLSGKPAAVDYAGKRFDAPPGVSAGHVIASDPAQPVEAYLQVAGLVEGEYSLVYQAKTKLSALERVSIFVLSPRSAGGLPEVRLLRENVPAPVAKSSAKAPGAK